MISSVSARGLFATALLTGMAGQAVAVEVPINWTGLGPDHHWTTSANWESNTAPANDGTAHVRFGPAEKTYVLVDANQHVKGLTFDFSASSGYGSYTLAGTAPRTLTIGASGLTVISGSMPALQSLAASSENSSGSYRYAGVLLDSSLGLVLGADQTWTTSYDSSVIASGNISGPGKLTLDGDGTVYLEGNNTYTGGTTVGAVQLGAGSDAALGTGTVTFNDHASLFGFNGDRTLANAFSLNGNALDLYNYEGFIKLTGAITLGTHVSLRPYGGNLFLDGSIGESTPGRILTIDGDSAVVLSGANTYTGGTFVYGGALIFRHATSVPAIGSLVAQASGYIGTAFATGVQAGFIDKFDKGSTYSTIGFDTDPLAPVTTFAEPIDLTGFTTSARLGSTTRAILAGNITPANGAGYQFGGGGGTLTVKSKLTGANSLYVESGYYDPLTLRIENPNADTSQPWNDYTGTTTAINSAIIFGPGALSSGSNNGSFDLDWGGYIGSQDATAAAFIAKFNPALNTGVIGFDSVDRDAPRTVSGVNLSQFTTSGSAIALGSATAARISGAITLPAGQPDYIFAGYKGGWLHVDSTLTGGGVVQIGDYYGDYPDFDPSDATRMSTVFLNGSNTHTGGTELHSGRLVLGNAGAFGTGAFTVSHGYSTDSLPRLETSLTTSPVFTNAVVANDDFEIGGVNAFTLAGNFRHDEGGNGSLNKYGAFNLTLAGDNSAFEGSFHIVAGTLTFAGGKAAGGGESWLTFGGTSGTAVFNADARSATPVIAALESYSTGSRVELGAGTTLTINQSYDTSYAGTLQGSGALVKSGGGTLRLESASTYTGATIINAGSIGYAKTGALGTGTVTLNGPSAGLIVEPGATFTNSLAFGGTGGVLGGNGVFGNSVTLTAGSGVSPGHSVGQLTFNNGLTWNGGAFYELEVQDATGAAGIGYDTIQVNGTLAFNATIGAPFTLQLSSLTSEGASGNVGNFLATNSYSWQIVSTTGGIVGFNSAALLLDTTGFTNALGVGSFNVAVVGNNLLLNFTPVPEPSTWALMIAGLGVVGIAAWRRRR